MAGLRKKQRLRLIGAGFALLALAFGITYFFAGSAFEYFYSPSQLAEAKPPANRVIRIGGLVAEGSLEVDGETVRFTVTDGAAEVRVTYTGIRPDLFREGQGTIATGRLNGDVFEATNLLAKHDENYMPKEVADALKEQGVFKPGT